MMILEYVIFIVIRKEEICRFLFDIIEFEVYDLDF